MDHQTFQIVAGVFALLASIIGALVMLWINGVQKALTEHVQRHTDLAEMHQRLAIEVAKNYMPRDELQETLNRIFELLEDIRKEVRHA